MKTIVGILILFVITNWSGPQQEEKKTEQQIIIRVEKKLDNFNNEIDELIKKYQKNI